MIMTLLIVYIENRKRLRRVITKFKTMENANGIIYFKKTDNHLSDWSVVADAIKTMQFIGGE